MIFNFQVIVASPTLLLPSQHIYIYILDYSLALLNKLLGKWSCFLVSDLIMDTNKSYKVEANYTLDCGIFIKCSTCAMLHGAYTHINYFYLTQF